MALQANANNASFQVTFTGKGLTIAFDLRDLFVVGKADLTVLVDGASPVGVSLSAAS